MMNSTIPKKIWMVWFQGTDNPPSLVKETVQSWKKLNPEWEVLFLDNTTLPQYIDVEKYLNDPNIPPQALSDIVRIMLLEKHGGVWADASVFCSKPLDEWVYDYAPDGFFAFEKPRHDKLLSSWFLVASKDNPIVQKWYKATTRFWDRGSVMPRLMSKIYQKGMHLFLKYNIVVPLIKKGMHLMKRIGFFPYFWFHYLFDELYEKDRDVARIWDNVPKLAADGPHTIIFYGLEQTPNPTIEMFIKNNYTPVHKLSWRTDISDLTLQRSSAVALITATKKRYGYE